MKTREREAMQDIIKWHEEAISFFSNPRKSQKEALSFSNFLKNIGIDFQENELKLGNNPPDIIFRGAEFEIKEIDEEGRKRHDEYRLKLKKARSATTLKELMTPYKFKEITLQEIVNRIHKELEQFVSKYVADFRKTTNILFYINYSLIGEHNYTIFDNNIWKKWRSVSMVTNNNISCVFSANNDAPEFIKSIIGKLVNWKI